MKQILYIFILGSAFMSYAQSDRSKTKIKAGYFGEFVMHPGLYAGVDYNLIDKIWFDLHWDNEIGGYMHKWNNNSAFIQSTIGVRLTSSFSAFADINFGFGYMLSTPNGDVYQTNESGELNSKGRPYTSHTKPTISILFGWDGMRKKDIPFSISTGIEAYWQTGFNHITLPHAAFRLGMTYQLKSKSE